MTKVYHSSKRTTWATPPELVEEWATKLRPAEPWFDWDVCADYRNTKALAFYDKQMDGLNQEWEGLCWMNPPYGKEISAWVCAAYNHAKWGRATVVALLPARTDTKWFHEFIYTKPGVHVELLRGRLRFVGAQSSAPFPSMIVVFNVLEPTVWG